MPSRQAALTKQISKGRIGAANNYLLQLNWYRTVASKGLTEHPNEVAVRSTHVSVSRLSAGMETWDHTCQQGVCAVHGKNRLYPSVWKRSYVCMSSITHAPS